MVHIDGHELGIIATVTGLYGVTNGVLGKGWVKQFIHRQPVAAFSVAIGEQIGKGIIIYPGTNLTICVIGAQLKNVLKAREKLKEKKISAEIIYFPSLKPFDKNIVIKSVKKTQKIITVEELSAHDGLFNQCIKSLAGRKFKYKQIAIKDFIHEYGTYEELCNITGLSARNIIHQSLKLFN